VDRPDASRRRDGACYLHTSSGPREPPESREPTQEIRHGELLAAGRYIRR